MGFDLSIFKDPQFEADYVEWLVDEIAPLLLTAFYAALKLFFFGFSENFYAVIVALTVSDHGPFSPPVFTHRSI